MMIHEEREIEKYAGMRIEYITKVFENGSPVNEVVVYDPSTRQSITMSKGGMRSLAARLLEKLKND